MQLLTHENHEWTRMNANPEPWLVMTAVFAVQFV